MICEINGAIAAKIKELYPAAKVYDEDVPQGFEEGSFFINVIDSSYSKALNSKFNASVTYNVDYFPADSLNSKNECYKISVNILRAFDLLNGFRIQDKASSVTDDVLHIQFTVKYREIIFKAETKMNDITFKEGGN